MLGALLVNPYERSDCVEYIELIQGGNLDLQEATTVELLQGGDLDLIAGGSLDLEASPSLRLIDCQPEPPSDDAVTQSGPERGYATSWNPNWSEQYGPDAQAAKDDEELIEAAVESFKDAEYVPPELEKVKEEVHKTSLVDELLEFQPETDMYRVYLLEAYFHFCAWRKKDEEDIATILLLME